MNKPAMTAPELKLETVSGDQWTLSEQQPAARTIKEWDIEGLPLGYGVSEASARGWGLFISEHISDKEPKRFSEPGLFSRETRW